VEALKLGGLVDDELRWSGGTAVGVQVGDQLDRGSSEVRILYLFERLRREAALAGGVGRKLGLGSSAAGCVAALGWAVARERGPGAVDALRGEIARCARAGHREVQGGGGPAQTCDEGQ
jgi:hypothetical protein